MTDLSTVLDGKWREGTLWLGEGGPARLSLRWPAEADAEPPGRAVLVIEGMPHQSPQQAVVALLTFQDVLHMAAVLDQAAAALVATGKVADGA